MTTLELAQARVPMRKVGSEWHGPCPRCGFGSSPQTSDRFSVKADGRWFCRNCGHGDAVTFLREFEGKSCPEAHAYLGKECDSTTCPVLEKCSKGKKGAAPAPKPLRAPKPVAAPEFVPAAATPPAERWRQSAEKLIERAHAALLECPEQLDYLAGRGLPRAAVEKHRFGWLPEDLYRPRAAWGLEEILREDGKPKRLWLPKGILIPFFGADSHPFRLRIRRPKIQEGEARYYWVPGSGDDVPVLHPTARAHVVVESDLDGFLVVWHAGDLVGAIPLGTCSAKPKEAAVASLRQSLAILVALDFEPRENPTTGRHENPGGKAAIWWTEIFPRAKRWPPAIGKDPGEAYQKGVDLRDWILAGLPPVFHLPAPAPASVDVEKPEAVAAPAEPTEEKGESADRDLAGYLRGVSQGGIPYLVAKTPEILARVRELYPEEVPFLREEIRHLQGMAPEDAHAALLVKQTFPESRILGTRPIVGDGRFHNVIKFDPSRARASRRGSQG